MRFGTLSMNSSDFQPCGTSSANCLRSIGAALPLCNFATQQERLARSDHRGQHIAVGRWETSRPWDGRRECPDRRCRSSPSARFAACSNCSCLVRRLGQQIGLFRSRQVAMLRLLRSARASDPVRAAAAALPPADLCPPPRWLHRPSSRSPVELRTQPGTFASICAQPRTPGPAARCRCRRRNHSRARPLTGGLGKAESISL